jgi:glycosyltransferase involved in cell wall biosynthesis
MATDAIAPAFTIARQTTSMPSVSVVMPCLNEEATVGVCVAKAVAWLQQSGVTGEVIVVDNGSTDRSVELAEAAGARVLHERRRGYGQAYLRGFAEARSEFVVMGDSDDTYDFTDLSRLIEPLTRGADMVIGNRFAGGISRGAMPWTHRYIGSPLINYVIRLFFGKRLGDSQSGLRAFRRSIPGDLRLRSTGMELASEMIVSAARAGLRIDEVPAPYEVRRGESKLNTMRDGWRHIRYLLLAAPDFLFTFPGLLMVSGGLLATLVSFLAPDGLQIGTLTWQPVFAGTILMAAGVNALLFGVVAKLYGYSQGLFKEDRWLRLYRRWFRLEPLIAIGSVSFIVGLAIEVLLLADWTFGVQGGHLALAALAQTLLIVGAELGMTGFLVMTVATPAASGEL